MLNALSDLHCKMSRGGWTHYVDMALPLHMIVDQAPLLQKPVDTHDGSHITSKGPSTCRDREVLGGVQPKTVYHEVAVGKIAACMVGGGVEEMQRGEVADFINASKHKLY